MLSSIRSFLLHTKILKLESIMCFHASSAQNNLMEFFDTRINWGASEVKVGRSWKKEELRLKSNSDLHKLWYVLLKEKNMLLTMEHECKTELELFPNPERIDKVEESMKNLEDVVKERNKAYWDLEIGETEIPEVTKPGTFRDWITVKAKEHRVPKGMNPDFKEAGIPSTSPHRREYEMLRNELSYLSKKKAYNRKRNHILGLLRRFPDIDIDLLTEKYPEYDLHELKNYRRTDGHYDPWKRSQGLQG